jgi:Fe-S oxidoreductase
MVGFLRDHIYSQEVYDFAYSCSLCGCCERACPLHMNFMLLVDIVKAELVRHGFKAPPSCELFLPREKYNAARVLESLQIKPSQRRWVTRVPRNPEKKKVVIFLSCFVHQTQKNLFASLDILGKIGEDFIAIGGVDYCCGEMDLSVGNLEVSDEMARSLVDAIEAYRAETAVFLCGGCFYRFKCHLPLFLDFSFDIKPLSQFYLENIEKIRFTRSLDEQVTYHDPCGLGRRSGFFDIPRELLRRIPGLEIVEMNPSRENSRCCGGMNMITNPGIAELLGEELGSAVRKTGTGKVITSCAGCHLTLSRIGSRFNFLAETYMSLLGRAMGIEYEDKLANYFGFHNPEKVMEEAKDTIEAGPFTLEEMKKLVPIFFPIQ